MYVFEKLMFIILASCAIVRPFEALIIGVIGGILAILCAELIERMKIDDPVGAVPVHGACGTWVRISFLLSSF